MMLDSGYAWFVAGSMVRIAAAFGVFFIYVPLKLFPQRPDLPWSERFFENFVMMAATAIVYIHILALLKIYGLIALLVCYVPLYLGVRWYYTGTAVFQEQLHRLWTERMAQVFDLLDGSLDYKAVLWGPIKRRGAAWNFRGIAPEKLVHGTLFTVILLYAAGLRFLDVFRSLAFGYSDSYSHLLWLKQLQSNVLYPSGHHQFYPRGFHAFMAVLQGLSGLDETISVRLTGPLVGVLLVLAAYYGARRVTGNREAGLVAMLIFGTFVNGVPFLDGYFDSGVLKFSRDYSTFWFTRQTAPLPEEFSLVFLLPAFFALQSYLVAGLRRDLAVFGLATLAIFLIHSLMAIALALGMCLLLPLTLMTRTLAWRSVGTVVMVSLGVALLGNLQMLYGWLFASTVQQAGEEYADWLQGLTQGGSLPISIEILTAVTVGLLLGLGGLFLGRGKRQKLTWSFTSLYLVLLAWLARSQNFGIPYLLPTDRVTNYRVLFLYIALGAVFYLLVLCPLRRAWRLHPAWVPSAVTALALGGLAFVGFPATIPEPPRYEHGAFPRVTYNVRRNLPPLEWTLISTVEDYSQSMKGGWHMNINAFLESYDPYDPLVKLPTRYTLLYIEKRLFGASSDKYNFTISIRRDVQRRLQEWANIYGLYHDNLSVYYEDDDVMVFMITQEQSLKKSPKDTNTAGASPFAFVDRVLSMFQGEKNN